jgi:hypothetical protein
MKWLFLTALVLVAGAVAAFGIYTWGWHDRDAVSSDADDRALADSYGRQIMNRCTGECRVENLHEVAPGVWEFTAVYQGVPYCAAIQLDSFRATSSGNFTGWSRTSCE